MVVNIENIVRKILNENDINVIRIILFGSRARGDFDETSDWDVLVVIDRELAFPEKHSLITKIQRELAQNKIPNDIIIKSENQFREMKDLPGSISFYADKEGLLL
jgi:uncharacterized protein